jgi:hypothetical protein
MQQTYINRDVDCFPDEKHRTDIETRVLVFGRTN